MACGVTDSQHLDLIQGQIAAVENQIWQSRHNKAVQATAEVTADFGVHGDSLQGVLYRAAHALCAAWATKVDVVADFPNVLPRAA